MKCEGAFQVDLAKASRGRILLTTVIEERSF
jgi:hypothetical protein